MVSRVISYTEVISYYVVRFGVPAGSTKFLSL